jgi:hypothetical protein
MLIEFKIQLDGSGAARVTQAEAAANPSAATHKELGTVFVPAAAGPKGGSAPLGDGPGGGTPTGVSSGSGMVFVIGPIVICGSGPGETGLGGSAPLGDGPGGGPPAGHDKAGA